MRLANILLSCTVASLAKLAIGFPPYPAYSVGNYNLSSLGKDPEAACEFMVTMATMVVADHGKPRARSSFHLRTDEA